ncbi:MAG: tyrosine-type recombinase/integrase [Magnetococcales bacterium]|nr:tyrosine-type recombinase/integrase [Magnetococcales bacterium]
MTMGDYQDVTLQMAMERYLSEIGGQLSPKSLTRSERLARTLLKGLGGDQLIGSITPLALSSYRDRRLKSASAATVEKDFIFLSELFNKAITEWQIGLEVNPVSSLGKTSRSHGRNRRLRRGEQVRLLAACDQHINPFVGWVVRLSLETAMRKSEILLLKKTDIDLEKRVVVVPKSQNKAPRPVPLTQVAVAIFADIFAKSTPPEDTKLIFYGELGRYATRRPYSIDTVFRRVLLTARMKEFQFGDLRFEAISRMREAGLSELEIIAIAGTRAIRGRRLPQQQIKALIKRLDVLGVGLVGDKQAMLYKTKREPENLAPDASRHGKTRAKPASRGSFGVAVGIRSR